MKVLLFALVALLPSISVAGDCEELIALSKITTTTIKSQKNIDQAVKDFCSEYQEKRSNGKSLSASGSYGLATLSGASSNQSSEEVYKNYCLSSSNNSNKSDAYQTYVEAIAPGAYQAYETCKKWQDNDLTFDFNRNAKTSKDLSIGVHWSGKYNAILKYEARGGDTVCSWNTEEGNKGNLPTKENDKVTMPSRPSSVTLYCERKNIDSEGFVTITQVNNSNPSITIPWNKYINQDVLNNLNERLNSITNEINKLNHTVMAVNAKECPAGWQPFKSAQGRYIVGLNENGTLAESVGTALKDKENRPTGSHTHKYDDLRVGGNTGDVPTSTKGGYSRFDHPSTTKPPEGSSSVEGTNAPYIQLLMCEKL